MNEKTNTCIYCANEAPAGIHCPRCRCYTDMIMVIEAYAGSPFICNQLLGSLLAAGVNTCKQLEQRATQINVPKLASLAKTLRSIELSNRQSGLLGPVIKKLARRHADAR